VVAGGLNADGDPRLMQAVMENLLANAWKFTAKTPNPRIEVGSLEQPGADGDSAGPETVYFVRDNGAGFDMAYAERLFGAFQRLHSQAEFGGTGIGLATVQRVIRRHGGRVWAESEVGKGATFYFTLPVIGRT
jgi:light-regulated signal transduction histidine kinase (bacteriophytochrome)